MPIVLDHDALAFTASEVHPHARLRIVFQRTLRIPDNVTLVPLPPYSPELNPVERVWLHLKERFLSHRLLADYDAIADAACNAWNRLCAEVGRLTSLCSYPWIPQVRR